MHGGGILAPYKTKGHRVIAMPLCSTGLAPPAFTAPCRNQTSDGARRRGKRRACVISSEKAKIGAGGRSGGSRLCHASYRFVVGLGLVSVRHGCPVRVTGTGTWHRFKPRRPAGMPGTGTWLPVPAPPSGNGTWHRCQTPASGTCAADMVSGTRIRRWRPAPGWGTAALVAGTSAVPDR